MCWFYLFLLSVLIHSSCGIYIEAEPSIPLYDGPQEYVNTKSTSPVNEDVMKSVLNAIVISLRQDLSVNTKTAYLLATLKGLLKRISANNTDVTDKIDELWHILKNNKEFGGINEDILKVLVKSNKRLQFEYDLPNLSNSYCNEAVLKIARIAYEAYASLSQTPICNLLENLNTPTTNPSISESPDLDTLIINPIQTDFIIPSNNKDVIFSEYFANKNKDVSKLLTDSVDITPIEFDLLKPNKQELITDNVKDRKFPYESNPFYPHDIDAENEPYSNPEFDLTPFKPKQRLEKLELINDKVRDNDGFYESNPLLPSDIDQDYIPYSEVDFDLNPSKKTNHRPEKLEELINDKVKESEVLEFNPLNPSFPHYNNPNYQEENAYPILPLKVKPSPSDYETNDLDTTTAGLNTFHDIPEVYDMSIPLNNYYSDSTVINSNEGSSYHERPFQVEYENYGLYPQDINPVQPLYDVIPKPVSNIVPQNDFPITSPKSKESEYLRTMGLIKDAIGVIEAEIPATVFDLATLYDIAEIKNKLKNDKYIQINEYWVILELYKELINYIKQLNIYDQIIDRFEITRVTNPDKLEGEKVVELTYLVKRPTPIVYYPYYYVKYTLPYPNFVNSANSLLKPNELRPDTEQYKKLLAHSKVVDTSQDLKNYKKKDLLGLVLESGYLVNAQLVGEISTLTDHLDALKDITAELSAEEVLKLNNHAINKVNKLAGNTEISSNDIETVNLLSKMLKENEMRQMYKSIKDTNAEALAKLETFDSNKLRNTLLRAEHVGFPYSEYSTLFQDSNIPEREQMSPVMYKLLMETIATSLRGQKQQNLLNSQGTINISNGNLDINNIDNNAQYSQEKFNQQNYPHGNAEIIEFNNAELSQEMSNGSDQANIQGNYLSSMTINSDQQNIPHLASQMINSESDQANIQGNYLSSMTINSDQQNIPHLASQMINSESDQANIQGNYLSSMTINSDQQNIPHLASQMINSESNQTVKEINNSEVINVGEINSSPEDYQQVINSEMYGQQNEGIETNAEHYDIPYTSIYKGPIVQVSSPVVARYTKIVTEEHDI